MMHSIPIKYARPPFWDRILAQFPEVERNDVIFSWGTCLYRPNRVAGISKALMAHEAVHCDRQMIFPGGVEGWWVQYLSDPQFRLDEEIPAHRAELRVMQAKAKSQSMKNHAISQIARRLAGPLYGNLITIAEARKRLTE